MSEENNSIVQLVSLQKDMDHNKILLSRMDATLEKLTEVSANVSRLLAMHEQRLETQEKTNSLLTSQLEKLKDQHHSRLQKVEEKINITIQDLSKKIDTISKKVWFIWGVSMGIWFILNSPITKIFGLH
jgi:tetrahydromethanopterin S-methyltransferase subunit G